MPFLPPNQQRQSTEGTTRSNNAILAYKLDTESDYNSDLDSNLDLDLEFDVDLDSDLDPDILTLYSTLTPILTLTRILDPGLDAGSGLLPRPWPLSLRRTGTELRPDLDPDAEFNLDSDL